MRRVALQLLVCCCLHEAASPAFEVVSLKYAGQTFPGRLPHGICKLEGVRVMCEVPLGFLLRRSFHLQPWEMVMAPDGHTQPTNLHLRPGQQFYWPDFEYYQVNAIAPRGTTEETKEPDVADHDGAASRPEVPL